MYAYVCVDVCMYGYVLLRLSNRQTSQGLRYDTVVVGGLGRTLEPSQARTHGHNEWRFIPPVTTLLVPCSLITASNLTASLAILRFREPISICGGSEDLRAKERNVVVGRADCNEHLLIFC